MAANLSGQKTPPEKTDEDSPTNPNNMYIQGLGSNSFCTPTKNNPSLPYQEKVDEKLERRREVAYNALIGYGQLDVPLDFDDLTRDLGLVDEFNIFENKVGNLFQPLASAVPIYSNYRFKRTSRNPMPSVLINESEYIGKVNEIALTAYFVVLIYAQANLVEDANHSTQTGVPPANIPTTPYHPADHQMKPIPESGGLKPNRIFKFPGDYGSLVKCIHITFEAKRDQSYFPDKKDFSQLADYAWSIWKEQPTRLYVPILFLHGSNLDLFVFTRGGWRKYELGQICHDDDSVYNPNASDMFNRTFVYLWFLLSLPTSSFGHFCDVQATPLSISFSHTEKENHVLASAQAGQLNLHGYMNLIDFVPRKINPRGCMVHLYNVVHNGNKAILKLAWTPVDRLPEGALYEILHSRGVKGIPKLYDSGIICEDCFGYRVEYLVIEHCGVSIPEYISKLGEEESNQFLVRAIRQIASVLVKARAFGVMHRDVSIGNIAVKDGNIYLIDWGYAKILPEYLQYFKDIAGKWGFDQETLANEKSHDHLTGTPLFMSVPVLYGAEMRSVVDDLESLFYVILESLKKRQETPDKDAIANEYVYCKDLAKSRIACLSCKEWYLKAFGVSNEKLTQELRQMLDVLYETLFTKDGQFLGIRLILDKKLEREFTKESLQYLVHKDVIAMLENRTTEDIRDDHVDERAFRRMSLKNPSQPLNISEEERGKEKEMKTEKTKRPVRSGTRSQTKKRQRTK